MISHNHYLELIKTINEYNYHYYVLDTPLVSDNQYDQLYQSIKQFELDNPVLLHPNSPTQRVGDVVSGKFKSFNHPIKLQSLSNIFNHDDLTAFCERIEKELPNTEIEYTIEPKIDGLAISIHYQDGQLIHAATRGNGTTGELVTENIKTIKSLPLILKDPLTLEVRGEVFIKKSDFKSFEGQFVNARNMAAGSLKQLDPSVTAKRNLSIFIYQGIGTESVNHFDTINFLKSLYFPTISPIFKTSSLTELKDSIHNIFDQKNQFDYDIDGVVVKVNHYSIQQKMGSTAKSPRWAVAYKQSNETASTTLNDVIFQVGRTGIITPVAILEPVFLSGVTIQKASLHNFDFIESKSININDLVSVKRAGEVIPEIVESLNHFESSKAILKPTHCPCCNSPLSQRTDNVGLFCTNYRCPDQVKYKIAHFVSKNALNIERLGEKVIEQLMSHGLLTCISDIYRLNYHQLIELDRMGNTSVNHLLSQIEQSKCCELSAFIYGLGIPYVGEQSAEIISNYFKSLSAFMKATHDQLLSIKDIGPKIADSIIEYLNTDHTQSELNSFSRLGVEPKYTEPTITDSSISGQTFLITGTLQSYSRKEAEKKIRALGGNVISSVSKNLNYLVTGESPGSKLKKANAINETAPGTITIISESDFLNLLA